MLIWIIKRARQFFRALFAKITLDDEQYISLHLNSEEQKLFFAMSTADQFHSLNVAYTIERVVIEDKKNIDRNFLIRCALLHDVGRVKGDLNIFQKVFVVLVTKFAPNFAEKLERNGNHSIYVYHHHAEIGARKLQKLNLFRESKVIAKHHSPPDKDDSEELRLLRLADEKN